MNAIRTAALAFVAAITLVVGSVRAEPDIPRVPPVRDPAAFLRLRPLKEPGSCVSLGTCPVVRGPRINKRYSTIPGTSNPDYGRPIVPKLQAPRGGYASPYRSFGGNRGITGGM